MSKKKLIGIAVASLIVLILFVGCSLKKARLVNTQEIAIEKIKDININYQSDSVYLYKSKTDQLIVKEYLAKDDKKYLAEIETSENAVTITGGKRPAELGMFVQDSKIEIYLPKSYHGDLAVTLASGSFKTDDYFSLGQFQGEASSGEFVLNDLKAKNLSVNVRSGSVKANKLTARKLKLTSHSGSLKIAESNADTIEAKTTSGSLAVSKLRGDADIRATSGSIKVDEIDGAATIKTNSGSIYGCFVRVTGDLKAEATSGSIKLIVPEETSFNFSGETTSGSIHTDFDERLKTKDSVTKAVVGDEPKYDLTSKVTSGSLTIRFL